MLQLVPTVAFRAVNQLRANIKALLQIRKEEQKALAFAARIDPSTLSKFLKGEREIQLANLDDVADFFGVTPYQLFQPGISSLTERRTGLERRGKQDRRIGHTQRVMLSTAAEVDAHRPPRKGAHVAVVASSPVMEALAKLTNEYERRITALISQAESRGQTAPARGGVPKARARGRAPRGSDPPKD